MGWVSVWAAVALLMMVFPAAAPGADRPSTRMKSGALLRPSPEADAAAVPSRKLVLPSPSAHPLTEWNEAFLDAVRVNRMYPPPMTRILAMMNLAAYDSLNTISPRGSYYIGPVTAVPGGAAHPDAAVTGACREVLRSALPSQAQDWEALARRQLAALPSDAETSRGLELGAEAGRRILALRASDGSTAVVSWPGGSAPGVWRPTRPAFRPALSPHWKAVVPFALARGDQFRPSGPPALGSVGYAIAFADVDVLGEYFSKSRSDDQTDIAFFWEADAGSITPPGYWVRVAVQAAADRRLDRWQQSRLLGLVSLSVADAAVAAWDAKYTHGFWRPITAIPLAEQDGNPATNSVPQWTSLLVTPPHPEYPSGHSTFSSAAAEILAMELGDVPVEITSDGLLDRYGLPEFSRSYPGFRAAAAEAGRSRVYGGIHYQFSNEAGLSLGRNVATWVRDHYLTATPGEVWLLY